MRYRKLDSAGDYSFGNGQADFLANTPDTVGQAVLTRLRLWQGEWFTDTDDGTAWATQVLDKYTESVRDAAIRSRVLGTPGVRSLLSYRSSMDTNTRTYTVQIIVDTIYGNVALVGTATLPPNRDRLDVDFYLDRSFVL